MPYARLFYHAVWATRNREPFIDSKREEVITASFQQTCSELNLPLFGVGIVAEHIHIALSIPPSIAISDVMARLKGASSRRVSLQTRGEADFKWQSEYGIISITDKALPTVLDYLANQKERHANNDLIASLERFE